MNSVLVFMGRNSADSSELRRQLLRIPEVSHIFKEAQQTLDVGMDAPKELISFMLSDANEYLSAGLWRELCAQLVQIGLYRRYTRQFKIPQFVIGDAGDVSAAAVCFQKITLEELIVNFCEDMTRRESAAKNIDFLVGHKLETAKAYKNSNGSMDLIGEGKDTLGLLEVIAKDYLLDQIITLGTAQTFVKNDLLSEMSLVESVTMDPLLSWMSPFLLIA